MVPERIEWEVTISAPVERVWAVLTDPAYVGKWAGDLTAEVDLRPGGTMVLRWAKCGDFIFSVERVEPPRFLAYHWGQPLDVAPRPGHSTLVEFTLMPVAAGTQLQVVESGFRDLDAPHDEQSARAEGNAAGWEAQLGMIRDYVQRLAA